MAVRAAAAKKFYFVWREFEQKHTKAAREREKREKRGRERRKKRAIMNLRCEKEAQKKR